MIRFRLRAILLATAVLALALWAITSNWQRWTAPQLTIVVSASDGDPDGWIMMYSEDRPRIGFSVSHPSEIFATVRDNYIEATTGPKRGTVIRLNGNRVYPPTTGLTLYYYRGNGAWDRVHVKESEVESIKGNVYDTFELLMKRHSPPGELAASTP